MFNTICVGYDGSGPSENAVRMACDLADKYHGVVHIVHTPHPETVAFAMGAVAGYHAAVTMPDPKETQEAAETLLEKARATAAAAGQSDVKTHIGQGDAAKELTEYAKEVKSDLIVTGRRGLGNLTALVMGSTSQAVSHHATCAHLTVT
ncbi:MAG: universal stress protein [Pseudomonadota bacterium]